MRPEKTLGVLGGMGPAATADFLRVLAERTPAGTDQEHPRMIVYSHTITPDRTTFLLGKGPDPHNRQDRDGTARYYVSEAQMTDNQHGTGACMMAVSEQLRWKKKGESVCCS